MRTTPGQLRLVCRTDLGELDAVAPLDVRLAPGRPGPAPRGRHPDGPSCRRTIDTPERAPRLTRVFRRAHILMASVALCMGVLAVLGAVIFDAKLVDPDGFIGPSYLRLPTVVALGFAIDLIPARCGSRGSTRGGCRRCSWSACARTGPATG